MTDRLAPARDLILRHGWNSSAYQLLNPGFSHWFSPAGDALVGFVSAAGTRVAAGAPVCPAERAGDAAEEFEAAAHAAGERVCWLGAGARLVGALPPPRHPRACVGAEPWWDPGRWAGVVESRASLRAQLSRARNKHVTVTEWHAERAASSSALSSCLQAWLARQGLPPLHFLVEPGLLAHLLDRRVFVAERDGAVAGYLLLSPVPARNGWLVEQIVRSPRAPNGTTELLVDAAMRAAAEGRAEYLSLGVAPLSSRGAPVGGPLWLRLALGWARAHGRRFYNFGGLEAFKAKFRPNGWDPVWLIGGGGALRPRDLWAVISAYAGGSPAGTLSRAFVRALDQERHRGWRAIRRRDA